jgi:membrane-bound metal-dependent hydrolase YbcI (DUF457 family)
VDPATHALFGAALVCGAASRPARRTVVVCAVASVLPDIDCVLMPSGWDRYLVAHEVGTHSLAGAALVGALFALALTRRRVTGAASMWAAALAGALGHVFWDVANGGDIRLFWPVWPERIGGHLVAMADPVVFLPLLCFGVVLWRGRAAARPAAALVLVGLAGVLVARLGLQQQALAAHARAAGATERRAIEARWGTLADWTVYDARGSEVRVWDIGWGRPATLSTSLEGDAALAEAAAAGVAPARRALALWEFAFARSRPDGSGREVLVSDPRFCAGDRCALWFGGRQDARGRFTSEVVIVGRWRLERPLP